VTPVVALLLFAASVAIGLTVVTLASLSYAKWREGDDPTNERCPRLSMWADKQGNPYPIRCLEKADHSGPHRIQHPLSVEGADYWWNGDDEPLNEHPGSGYAATAEEVSTK
jgi:hypothetical protein